jgi:hypothetical protein
MVLSIGGIINAMLLPVALKLRIHAVIPDYILKKIILTRLFID